MVQRVGQSPRQSSNISKQSIRSPPRNVDKQRTDTDTRNAVLNFVHVSGDPPDHTLVRPSQLRMRPDQTTTHEADVHRNSSSFNGHHQSADNLRTRTAVTEDAADAAGKARSVSKSGATSENRRREQNDVLRRQTAVLQHGTLWPINHKDVS